MQLELGSAVLVLDRNLYIASILELASWKSFLPDSNADLFSVVIVASEKIFSDCHFLYCTDKSIAAAFTVRKVVFSRSTTDTRWICTFVCTCTDPLQVQSGKGLPLP